MIVILCTTNTIESARNIANTLIKDCDAACVNIVPKVVSIYKWNNKLITDEEYLLFIKTKKKLFNIIEEKIRLIHPYENPEIIALEIKTGSKQYLDYIISNCN